jgi:hypothetical protein
MKKLSLLFISLLCVFVSCKKETLKPVTTNTDTTKPQGYIVVECDNCKVEYGMPDQYHSVTVSGTSGKNYFSYDTTYTLKTYITSYDHAQKLTLSVYDKNGTLVQTNSKTQDITGYWDTYITVPAK